MLKSECDRCGSSAPVQVEKGFVARVPLPEGWQLVVIRPREEAVEGLKAELCERCVNALKAFFAGAGLDAGDDEPEGCIAHGGPDCICDDRDDYTGQLEPALELEHEHDFETVDGRCICGSTYDDVMARTESANLRMRVEGQEERCARGQHLVASESPQCPACGVTAPGPTVGGPVTRPGAVASVIPLPFADWQKCPRGAEGKCMGWYARGALDDHMAGSHGVTGA